MSNHAPCSGGQGYVQADDVASAQQFIEFDLLDHDIIDAKHMSFKAEHLAPKDIAQASNLQPDGAASHDPQSLAEQFVTGSSWLSPPARMAASAGTIRRNTRIIKPMANSLTAWTA